MGRRTYEVVSAMDGPWPYGDRPVLVATHRELRGAPPKVQAVTGEVGELVAAAKKAAGDENVYVDGGQLIRQVLDAGLVDELIITVISKILGEGVPLFAGSEKQHRLVLTGHRKLSPDMVQLSYEPT
jgi:dihydrofolate reductase